MHEGILGKWDELKSTPIAEIKLHKPSKGNSLCTIAIGTETFTYASHLTAKKDFARVRAMILVEMESISWLHNDLVHEVKPVSLRDDENGTWIQAEFNG